MRPSFRGPLDPIRGRSQVRESTDPDYCCPATRDAASWRSKKLIAAE